MWYNQSTAVKFMPQKAKTEADSMDEHENIVELTDEDGSVIQLEFLDLIEY